MNYGITPQGFIRKPFNVILQELVQTAQSGEYFGNEIDLSPESPLGALVHLIAWAIDRQWQLAEDVYYSMWLSTAEGVHLDRVCKLGFVSRRPATYATVVLRFYGEPGAEVPAKTQAETAQNIVFETISDAVITNVGYVDVLARCTVPGTIGIVQSGMINSIKTPLPGVDSVINLQASWGGKDIESDYELVERYQQLPAATGSSVQSIISALQSTVGVISATVFENTGNVTDSNGLPPKSVECIVQGGADQDVARTIFTKKAAGIATHGSEEIQIVDDKGIDRLIKFSRPQNINVYVQYKIQTNQEWSDDNIIIIKRNAIKYIGGVDDNNTEYGGVGISNTVYIWKLIAVQQEIVGVNSISVKIGKTYPPSQSNNLTFLPRERAWTDINKIEVVKI
jgi:uncharacterized phage protein gp47/JayE